ncbi:MAG: threonine--tRNA ligase [Candidatus Paceibacterota bacterium]|jgi:threonyl-tRNA synthetase
MEKEKLEKIRHSLSHLMSMAVQELYPQVGLGVGPAIDNGFYQDYDLPEAITPEILPKLEKRIREMIKENIEFKQHNMDFDKAYKLYVHDPYKTWFIDDLKARGEKYVSFYKSDWFDNLCAGPHVNSTKEIDPETFRLDRIAGAYWRGDEKNKMLTRIYGLAFESKEVLDAYILQQEEAKKRDHRKLGVELDLFHFSDTVGKGLPLFTPKGATIRRELERFIIDEEIKRGYLHVKTPDLARLDLFKKSGHYPHYKDSMYAPIKIDDEEFMLRPMTCPHHFELYLRQPHSYRELPMRIAELAQLYRYEQSGELSGLLRVRTFCLADAHIICASPEQAVSEIGKALDLIEYVSGVFGLKHGENFWYRLSLGDRNNTEKYFKNDSAWDMGEDLLRKHLQSRGSYFVEAPGEAAFYGPKVDIQMKNINGKEDTAFTVQYDFCMPERFDLTYTAEDGSKKQAVVVHRSSIGAIERIMAFLIEHYAGNFPLWLSPVQIKVIPVRTNHNEYAKKVFDLLKESGIRAEIDVEDSNLGGKVRETKNQRIPYWIVVGDKEVEADKVNLESRDAGQLGQMTAKELVSKLLEEIKHKK